jgi:DNA mismatch endonuclease (patch repair protein)
MMSGIRGTNTRPEMLIRKGLHSRGFRYRLHDKKLPGKPDIVFPRFKAVILVHGCFWHGHDCHLFKWPSTRHEFWRDKIEGNAERDRIATNALEEAGWRVMIVWECALKGKLKKPLSRILDDIAGWLVGFEKKGEIRGGQ